MRSFSDVLNGIKWDLQYPDSVVFAFNPLYCEISTSSSIVKMGLSLTYEKTTHSIDIYLINGKAKVEFSRILQLFFNDYINSRSLDITFSLEHDGATFFSTTVLALWGGISIGERFNFFGVYSQDDYKHFQKTRVWFKNFPFTVTMFSGTANPSIYGGADNNGEKAISSYSLAERGYNFGNSKRYGLFELIPAVDFPNAKRLCYYRIGDVGVVNIFDDSFDYTFNGSGIGGHLIKLIPNEHKEGFYLRWIDNVGQIQYYLFDKGVTNLKNTLDKYEIPEPDFEGAGMHFPNIGRNLEINAEATSSCCAVSLPDEIYEYVSTIVNSPYVDLLVSFDSLSKQIWLPVNIVCSSYEYQHKEHLHDLIISFSRPIEVKPTKNISDNGCSILDGPKPTGHKGKDDKAGFYIRWTDFLGKQRYRYFTKGSTIIKNTLDKGSQHCEDVQVGNRNFGNISRTIHLTGIETVKCCAVSLSEEEYEEVSTIVTAKSIDLYLGSTSASALIWMPINIVSSSHEFHHDTLLHDLIISFTKPAKNTQTI